jgi:multimeric flavodoxin WrbA
MSKRLARVIESSGRRKSLLFDRCSRLVRYLESKNDILLVTTSNRYRKHTWDTPKTTELALRIRAELGRAGKRVTLLDVTKLKIHTCEGNISGGRGNNCGVRAANLRDRRKNPTGQHRCWASINNEDDELYKVSRELFAARAVVFFVSVRWGQTNSVYQRLFERLSWIENRVTSLGEPPIAQLRRLESGIVVFGHNWNDELVLKTQKQNFKWFGWKTPAALSFSWQYTRDADDESPESYLGAIEEFGTFLQIRRSR